MKSIAKAAYVNLIGLFLVLMPLTLLALLFGSVLAIGAGFLNVYTLGALFGSIVGMYVGGYIAKLYVEKNQQNIQG
jgi:hypothetical protein